MQPAKESSSSEKNSKLSTRNILRALGTRFFSQTTAKEEETVITKPSPPLKEKVLRKSKSRVALLPEEKKETKAMRKEFASNRDYVMFRVRYNSKIGNIMRNWISTIYCILVLRTNLLEFLAEKVPEFHKSQPLFMEQMQVENEMIFKLIRKAQTVSQERFVHLWLMMENLLFNRLTIKQTLEALQSKEGKALEWKAAAEKLALYQMEMEKARAHCENMKTRLHEFLEMSSLKMTNLATMIQLKDKEIDKYKKLVEEGKKSETLRRERISANFKNYEKMKVKNSSLLKIRRQLAQLKNNESAMTKEHDDKVQQLNSKIEKLEEEIKTAKKEREKMKEVLDKKGIVMQEKILSAGEG